MPNAENINKVIASILGEIEATKNIGFNMGDWISKADAEGELQDRTGRGCGTVACIAGHAFLAAGGEGSDVSVRAAMDFLDIGNGMASELFLALNHDIPISSITPEHAIRTLEHLRDTGEVRWDLVVQP